MNDRECVSTMTTKGQITIPHEIREKLTLSAGDQFKFEVRDDGIIQLCKLSALERIQQTLGAECRRQGLTREALDSLIEETREKLSKELYEKS